MITVKMMLTGVTKTKEFEDRDEAVTFARTLSSVFDDCEWWGHDDNIFVDMRDYSTAH